MRSASRYSGTCRTGAALGHGDELLIRGPWRYVRLPTYRYQVQIRGTAPSQAAPSQSFYLGSWGDVLSISLPFFVLQLSASLVAFKPGVHCVFAAPRPQMRLRSLLRQIPIADAPLWRDRVLYDRRQKRMAQ